MEASLSDLAALRAKTYALYGSLFLHPSGERLAGWAAAAQVLRGEHGLARTFPFFRSWQALLDALAALDGESRRGLEAEHVRLFAAGGPHESCPPYESEYVDPSGRARGSLAVELERVYAEAGLGLSGSMARELPDHVTLELEFMSLLCAEEKQRWESSRPLEAADCLGLQKAFLEKHLARWFPAFAQRVWSIEGRESFYGRLSEAAHAFIVHDRDLAETLLELPSGWEPAHLGPEG